MHKSDFNWSRTSWIQSGGRTLYFKHFSLSSILTFWVILNHVIWWGKKGLLKLVSWLRLLWNDCCKSEDDLTYLQSILKLLQMMAKCKLIYVQQLLSIMNLGLELTPHSVVFGEVDEQITPTLGSFLPILKV